MGLGRSPDEKDAEIAVLRHQIAVLNRQVARPRCTSADRLILATLSRVLPRDRWAVFLVTPATLLRWHRHLIAQKWTYPHTGNPHTLPEDTVEFVLRLAKKTHAGDISGSSAKPARSACGCQRHRCARSCAAMVWARHPRAAGKVRPGWSS